MFKKNIFTFLEALSANNHKDWMDAHRSEYLAAKQVWLDEIERLLQMLGKYDPVIPVKFQPKDTITRINNNRRFHPDRPPYKDRFTFTLTEEEGLFCPLHISVSPSGSFLGCGYHQPEKETLDNIRDAIDYEGEKLLEILNEPLFKAYYGGLSDFGGKLKTAPKGYGKDHPFVELLRYKRFVIERPLAQGEVIADAFVEEVEKAHIISKPFRDFLKRANSVSAGEGPSI
jgi:uncharacterized protein (TIGR02453 family)